ncbi:toprim domain-containing protein [Geobacter benzoatilyticus]|uniref:Toprim domain-containing protein n=1 Tax=Geobacter benzoatilyticus TaxID=2815309 RepID=A0ABX7PZU5_9BACT|nr:toprim domain-containing protein [Geobacter benzoatilyticus]QSV44420.1 toprim domain-containing protein [Geobacter benzoatilyticus]
MSKDWTDFGITIPQGKTGEVATTCPQCSPHRKKQNVKCLSVNVDKGVWHCNHCDWRGTLKSGAEERSNPYAWTPKTYRKPEYRPEPQPESGSLVDWFAARGIPLEVVKRNRITIGKVYMPQLEEEVNAIRFPYYRAGEVVNIKSRDHRKNFRMETGAERILYGLDDCAGADVLIIVEGEIDKLSLEVAGFLNSVSVPDGAPSPKAKDYTSKFSFIEGAEDFLSGFQRIILAVDNDEPGKKLEEELARRLGRERCWMVQWPEGCKDANDVLVKRGRDTLRECIEQVRPYPVQGLFDVADFSPQIVRLYDNGHVSGAKTGWPCLDRFITFAPGQWSLVTGIPGSGKSEFIDALLVNLALAYGWTFAVFSPENYPLELHVQKLAEKFVGKPFFGRSRMDRTELDKAVRWVNERFTFMLPEADELTVDRILNLAKIAVRRKGIRGIVVDPWNEIDHNRPANLSETEYISQSLSKIRRFAREHDIHVWVVAHPAKLRKEKDEAGRMVYPVPTPYDVSGSAHWRNKADNAVTVHREIGSDDSMVQVHVQKVRFKTCGKPGVVELRYDYFTGRYSDPEGRTVRSIGGNDECPY